MLVVVAPGNFAPSGGPEALHQLVSMANLVRPDSSAICYYPFNSNFSTLPEYAKYNCPVIRREQISDNDLVVLPEIWPEMSYEFKCRCALWWLSVGFFGSYGQKDISNIWLHLTQSHYAKQHLEDQGISNSIMVTDWIDFPVKFDENKSSNSICVNPAKGADLINQFESINNSFNIVKLQGMSKNIIIETLSSSLIYIDFGGHPGRDRFPREAAKSGAIVMSTKHGAAGNKIDMPLDDYFKFDTVEEAYKKAIEIKKDPLYFHQKQIDYVEWCKNDYSRFMKEVGNLLSLV